MHRKAGACAWTLSMGTMVLGLSSKVMPVAAGRVQVCVTVMAPCCCI
jgi:hypothetical protein